MTSLQDLIDAHRFVVAVRNKLPKIKKRDIDSVDTEILRKYAAGWSENEVVRLCYCFEEVNPKLKEATAIARMRRISSEVENRKAQ